MRIRRFAVIAATGAIVVAGGAGVAIGATGGDGAKKDEQAIIDDAAKRLDRTPEQLREALKDAQAAALDRAVKDGRLTQEQADRIKQRQEQSGRVLGVPGGKRLHRGGGFGFGPGLHAQGIGFVDDVAKALGVTRAELRDELRDGKSVADIAKANGKDLADVRSALRASAKTRLDRAVADGDLTRAQANAALEHLEDHLTRLDEPFFGRRGHRFGPPPGAERAPGAGEDPAGAVLPAAPGGSWS